LVIIGSTEAKNMVDRKKMLQWMLSLKNDDGSFVIHEGGEFDIRAAYCALSVAKLLDILTPELTAGVDVYVQSCQTYEGGIAAGPFMEAHGGYAFCGLAAMTILGKCDKFNLPMLTQWLVHRQMAVEGGFQGRTNKLVDGCYSFWVGGCFPLLNECYSHAIASEVAPEAFPNRELLEEGCWLCSQQGLQMYILLCGQQRDGGLRDKPGKGRDYYHTCYCLSGLSVSQHCRRMKDHSAKRSEHVLGLAANLVRPVDFVHNVCQDRVDAWYNLSFES